MTSLHLIEGRPGSWSFRGRVPTDLAYVQTDGSPITPDQAQAISHCGPGIVRGIRPVTFNSKTEALAAAEKLGVEVVR